MENKGNLTGLVYLKETRRAVVRHLLQLSRKKLLNFSLDPSLSLGGGDRHIPSLNHHW